jgi:hypothetical protein
LHFEWNTVALLNLLGAQEIQPLETDDATAAIFDQNHVIVGFFTIPAVDMSEWEPASPGVTDEELANRAQSNEWYRAGDRPP